MNCPRCQHDNAATMKFCGECGARIVAVCVACGAANAPAQKFCGECGERLHSAAESPLAAPKAYTPQHLAERIISSKPALEGERKQVTVLFSDLKGSMELLADGDPEEARRLLDPVLERMMEAVHRYEGTVNQVMGDGIMALFGAPIAHEDHAVRACYAALRMQESVARYAEHLRSRNGIDVQIRVGLNSGDVVVRSIGNDLRMDYTAVGQTTHLAARMEQLARPGTTLLTDATLRDVEGYVAVKPLGPTPVKGLADPVPVYELIGTGTARTRLQAAATRGLTRFVGRDAETDQLRRALEQARAGQGQLVAVVGEPGVGKSRLFYEFIHSHRTEGWLILESSSVSYGKASAYLPLIDLLKGYFKIGDRDDTRTVRARITGTVMTLDEALKDGIAPLLWLFDALPDDHGFLGLEIPLRRQHTLDAVKRVLLRESQGQPVLLVFEDLHWIDAETQTLLDALVESLPTAHILLAVNYRPEYRHGWAHKTFYRQLRIDALPPETAEAMLDPLLGTDASLGPLRQMLIARTEGNPLFIEESVRSLAEAQVLVGERGAYRLARDPVGIHVPATVQAILAARIDRLPPADKQLLQAASVIGKDVPWSLLLEISDLSEDDLRRGLARLQAAEFVYELRLFPDLEYTFKHALTHEVAYGSLLQERRQALHGRVVDAMERLYADRIAEHANVLVHHAFRGEVWHKAMRYLDETASSAARQSIDAVFGGPESPGNLWWRGLHERAIALAQRERALLATFRNFAQGIVANFRIAQACHSLGDYPRAAELLERNITVIEPDLHRDLFGLAGFPSVFSRVWLALCRGLQGRLDDAATLVDEAVGIAEPADHAFSLVVADSGRGLVRAWTGDTSGAIESLERGLVTQRMADIPLLFPLVAAPLGWAYARAGRHDEGVRMLQDAIDRAEAMEFAANHALRLTWLGDAHLTAGRPDMAKRIGLRALETARRYGERGHEACALQLLGDAAAMATPPDPATASEHYRAALTLAETLGMRRLAAALASCLP